MVENEQVQEQVQKELTPEQKAKLEELFKQVDVPLLSDDEKMSISRAAIMLETLEAQIVAKKEGALEKRKFIQDKIADLKAIGGISIDEHEYERSEASVAEFVRLLDHMIEEVTGDIRFYLSLLADEPPKKIWIFKFEPDDFMVYLNNRLKLVKKYVRKANRDLSVSYSRYSYGFDAQIRQLGFIEQYLKRAQINRKHVKES